MFEKLFEIAKESLTDACDKKPKEQVTVLFSDKNNYYIAVDDFDGLICEELRRNNDTKIVRLLTMWKGENIDLPSITFRRALVELDEYNEDTVIILQGKESHIIKKLSVTMP